MKPIICAFFAAFLCQPTLSSQQDTFLLFYLGGQSNMDGYGYTSNLLPEDTLGIHRCLIFCGHPAPDGDTKGGSGLWAPLKPGYGVGFASDGQTNQYSVRFGPEVSFGKAMAAAFPSKKIALIKYSRGGTSLDSLAAGQFGCWEANMRGNGGINQFDHCLRTIHEAVSPSDINGDGRRDVLEPAGILWMQGESDAAYTQEIALRYKDHLTRLLDAISAALHKDDLPVVIGRISDSRLNEKNKIWGHGELIQYAQEQLAHHYQNCRIVRDTEKYAYSDPWHYDSRGYIDLGHAFAREMLILLQSAEK